MTKLKNLSIKYGLEINQIKVMDTDHFNDDPNLKRLANFSVR